MKLKIIEAPKQSVLASKVSLFSVLSLEEKKTLKGGIVGNATVTCGVYNLCSKEGKSSCTPFSCVPSRYSCTSIYTWVVPPVGGGSIVV